MLLKSTFLETEYFHGFHFHLGIASAIWRRHHRSGRQVQLPEKLHQHVIISDCCSWWPRHNSFYHCSAIWQSEIRTGTELWHSESDFTQNDLPIVGGDLICITLNAMNDSSQGLKGRNCNWPNSMPSPIQCTLGVKGLRYFSPCVEMAKNGSTVR